MYKLYYIIHEKNVLHNNYINYNLNDLTHKVSQLYKKQTQFLEELKEDLQRIENDVRDEIDKMKSDEAMMEFAEKMQEKFQSDFRETMNAELKIVSDAKICFILIVVKVV